MPQIPPNGRVSATAAPLEWSDVAPAQTAAGRPRTGSAVLGEFAGLEVGVWEMSVGAMRDTESDELFVVLSGCARVDFDDGTASLHLTAGDVVHLTAGTRTLWTVTEPLRKVYLA